MNFETEQLLKFKVAGKLVPVSIKQLDAVHLCLKFNYSNQPYFQALLDEIKSMETARWNPAKKYWTIAASARNQWTLRYLTGDNPYKKYDQPLIEGLTFERPLRQNQKILVSHALTYRQVLWGVEMRCGKTLAARTVMEISGIEVNDDNCIWVAPRSALAGVMLEFRKWGFKDRPRMLTYEGLKKVVERWPSGKPAPQFIVFDEIQRIKTHMAQRSVASKYVADQMRLEWGDNCYIIGMTGTPAPKSPADWHHLAEVVCPGFLKEANIYKFKSRLGLFVQKESPSGGVYPEHVTWWDNNLKCKYCGKLKDEGDHTVFAKYHFHKFEPSKNEIAFLYERLRGLVVIQFKKDVLDLPDKTYETINCPPTRSMENALKILQAKSKRVISAMILARQLSDGFQYKEIQDGTQTCPICYGTGDINPELDLLKPILGENDVEDNSLDFLDIDFDVDTTEPGRCGCCKGEKVIPKYAREIIEVEAPKIDVVKDLLDEHEDVGRIVFFAGFHGSIDRLVKTAKKEGWETIKVDGRGWQCSIPRIKSDADMLYAFANQQIAYPKIAYIGHPGSGGLGIDLAASPTFCFYSNDFVGDNRTQAEDRGHGPAMNINRGCRIIDLVCLYTDQYIIDSLKAKRRLEKITMGEYHNAIKYYTGLRQT